MRNFVLFACILAASSLPLCYAQFTQQDKLLAHYTDAFQEWQKNLQKTAMLSLWSGEGANLLAADLVNDQDVRAAWNISEEQYQQIQVAGHSVRTNPTPEVAAEMEEMDRLIQSGKIYGEHSDPTAVKRYLATEAKLHLASRENVITEVDRVLTDEQKRNVQEFQLATMEEWPLVSPDAFYALNLNEEQKKKMEEIRKELAPEFERAAERLIDARLKMENMVFDTMVKEGKLKSLDQLSENLQETARRLYATDPAFKKLAEEMKLQGNFLCVQVKTKMFDVLTDEQWAKLENIVDNPPEYVKNMVKKIKQQMGQNEDGEASGNVMDAWKPGEPIPEEYRQKRARKAFPQAE